MQLKLMLNKPLPFRKFFFNELTSGVLLATLAGIGAGFGAVLFWKMISLASMFFFKEGSVILEPLGKYYVILIPAIGGLIFGPLVYFLAREAQGEGPPDVMESLISRGGRIRPRVAVIKVVASSLCIGSGGSVGREGPIVQIGSAIGSSIGQWFKLSEGWMKTLVLCGAAGGISATFNAPLAGIIFAVEVISKSFFATNFAYIVISSVSANVIARVFLFTHTDQTSFVIPQYTMVSYWELVPYFVLGLLYGLFAVGFVRFFYQSENFFTKLKVKPYLKPVLGGLIVGIIGLYFPQVFGVGYGVHYGPGGVLLERGPVDQALAGELTLSTLVAVLFLKIFATSVTLSSGGSGGVFAPSLFIGAVLGGVAGTIVHNLFPAITATSGAYALVGMGAFFASVVRGPITAIIILFELTRDYALILPLMLAVVVSIVVARLLNQDSIYNVRLIRHGVNPHHLDETSPIRKVTAFEAMVRKFPLRTQQHACGTTGRALEANGTSRDGSNGR